MPLKQGSTESVISENIRKLRSEGKPEQQAVAIAESVAHKSKNAAAEAAPSAPGGANTSVPTLGERKKKPLTVEFDKSQFETIEEVAVFDSHPGSEENLDFDFTPEILQEIASACNARIQDTGDLVPITDRHTTDDPKDKPEILGFASNFRVDDFGKVNPRKAIYADFHIYKDRLEKAKSLPRRSIELWLDDLVADPIVMKSADRPPIDSVALLGPDRPARDLGLLFSKNQNRLARYRREVFDDAKEIMNPDEVIKQCLQAFTNTPVYKWAEQQMQQAEAEAANKEQFEEEADKKPVEEEKKDEAPEGDEPEDKEQFDKEDEDEDKLEPAKLRMQRDQERRKYAKLESQYKALFGKVEALERDKRVANRKADLMDLEGQGYAFDLADELEYVSDMQPQMYSKHLAKIRKNYAKAPIGVSIKPAPVKAEGGVAPAIQHPSDMYAKLGSQYKPTRTFDKKPE